MRRRSDEERGWSVHFHHHSVTDVDEFRGKGRRHSERKEDGVTIQFHGLVGKIFVGIMITLFVLAALITLLVTLYNTVPAFRQFVNHNILHMQEDGDGIPIEPSTVVTVTELKDLEVAFLDVGQGDCILICFPDGRNMLIDSGDTSNANKKVIGDALEERNITRIDYLLATHKDADHVGNMEYIFANYEIKKFFRPNIMANEDYLIAEYNEDNPTNPVTDLLPDDFNTGAEKGTQLYSRVMYDAYIEEGCVVERFNKNSDFAHKFIFEEQEYIYSIDFLTPVADVDDIEYSDANDYSPIMLLTYGETKLLLTGDAETEMEREFLTHYTSNMDVDILKVGHHGSETSTSQALLDLVNPEYAVIQCGNNKTYQHPRQATLDRLYAEDITVYRTDNNGTILLTIEYRDLDVDGDVFDFVLANTDCSRNHIGKDTDYANGVLAVA